MTMRPYRGPVPVTPQPTVPEAPADLVHRAGRALELLDDPVLADAFARAEHNAIEAMLAATDDDTRRRKADFANAVRAVRAELKADVLRAQADARRREREPFGA